MNGWMLEKINEQILIYTRDKMTVKIAICDDERYICSQLESELEDIMRQFEMNYEIDVFESGESLCKELERQIYDLIFLDIELPENSGIDVGRYIREVLKNEMVQIVYISGKDGYAMELFEFRPMNFLVKPLEHEKVAAVIEKYRVVTEQKCYMFEYKKRGEYYKVPMSDIMYFENQNRKVTLYAKDFEDEFYDSMENIYEKVKNQDFLLIHKSIIVNYRYVKNMDYKEVTMVNGKRLSISQSKRPEVKAKHMQIRKRER